MSTEDGDSEMILQSGNLSETTYTINIEDMGKSFKSVFMGYYEKRGGLNFVRVNSN